MILQHSIQNVAPFPVEMRLKVKNGINNCSIIDDSYSSDFQSLKIALDFLESQKQFSKKTVILSDIFKAAYQPKNSTLK
jgi:alanine racemase